MENGRTSKTVLFNLDQTLYDRQQAVQRYAAGLHKRHLVGTDTRAQSFVPAYLQADAGGHTDRVKIYDRLAEHFRLPVSFSLDVFLADWERFFVESGVAIEGSLQALDQLRAMHLLIGLVTNGTSRGQRRKIALLGLGGRFDTVLISQEVQMRKPDANIYLSALSSLNADPEHAYFVSCKAEEDLLGAAAAGLKTIWFNPGRIRYPAGLPKPNYEIRHLEELIAIAALTQPIKQELIS